MTLDRSFTPFVIAVAFCLPTSAHAQDSIPWPRGDRLSVSVTARLLASTGDTMRIEYTVTNAPNSEQQAWIFVVRAFLPEFTVRSPTLWWGSRSVIQDSAVAAWDATGQTSIQAGSSLAGFQVAGVGVPEPVAYRVQGEYDLPVVDEGTPIQRSPSAWVNSVPGFTVGIVPFPSDSTPVFLLGRLRTLTDRACDLGWLTPTQCGVLRDRLNFAQRALGRGDVAGARGDVQVLRNDVSALTGDAFALLKPNADYALRLWPARAR